MTASPHGLSPMNPHVRLTKLRKHFAAVHRIEDHWVRVWTERLAALDQFRNSVPPSHRERVEAALGGFESRLLVAGPVEWPGREASAMLRWVLMRTSTGPSHPWNGAQPEMLPTVLLDALFDHPATDFSGCRGCAIPLPWNELPRPWCTAQGRYLFDVCPVCEFRLEGQP